MEIYGTTATCNQKQLITARRVALAAARRAAKGTEHSVLYDTVTYVADGVGGATRIVTGPDGTRMGERMV